MSARIPSRLLGQQVVIEAYEGSGAYGDVFGDPTTWQARVEFSTKLVNNADGEQVVSTSQVYLPPEAVGQCSPGSKVTLPGESTVRESITYAPAFGAHKYHHVRIDVE